MEEVAKEVFKFELRPDDIWIVTYPKCGTALIQVSSRILYVQAFVLSVSLLALNTKTYEYLCMYSYVKGKVLLSKFFRVSSKRIYMISLIILPLLT